MRYQLLCGVLAAAAMAGAGAQVPPDALVLKHPWVVAPPSPKPEAYFLGLKDGAKIETPYVLRFGLSLRGLAPAEVKSGKAVGHHHLLIDYPIPTDMSRALPFTDQYLHFGKGEMQTILKLKPGVYQLALLLADEDHVPYPVYSKPIRVTVTKHDPGVNIWKLWGEPQIGILQPADGERVQGPFRVNFHANGYNVAAAASKSMDGWFRLTVEPRGKPPEVLDFKLGQTEVWLNPPKGDYTLRLDMVSNRDVGKLAASARPVHVVVP
ncbi:DUF4399 domain-containing protein [Ramlibacter albus]|uniref:DUF4399 domain-containing protein n=1 Tax=Ramlibacter albus TaxID=2079448 RepID=A0A923S124_9BURK|nr:DUF4399 domain-containing protein [Ramlibacter albus]MBC5763208.1 DUF4399 domain-containing protein [Ramlibacter albus]